MASLLAALSARPSCAARPALSSRGHGECRGLAAPMARLRKKCRRQVPQVQPRHPAFPARWLERLLRVLPGAPGFLATVACATRERHRKRDTSVGVSGPRDLTVRINVVRRHGDHAATSTRPPHPASTSVTTAKRPSYRDGTDAYNHNFRKNETEIFFH